MAYDDILAEFGIRNGSSEKLECIAEMDQSVVLRKSCGELCEVGKEEYRCLIAGGHASPLNAEPTAGFIPDEHARITQSMKLHAVRRDDELRCAGNSAKKSAEIIGTELRENPRFVRYVPAQFGLRTLQHWKQCKSKDGRSALLPKTHLKGNRGERYDELYEEIALDALEEIYLKNDRISIGKLSDLVAYRYEQAWYKKHGADTHKQLNPHGKRSLVAVLRTLRVDDIISYRHDSETAKKLRLQAQFFHRVQMPFDLVEVDCTPGNIHLVGVDRTCIGRPTFSIAVDAVTGVPVGLRISLTAPREELTVQTIKDVMTDRGDAFFEKYNIENRFEMTGVPQIISSDQGSENSGGHLSSLIEQSGAEWGKNAPGCPEKKPFVERFNRELSEFLQTLPGSTHTKELPNKERTEKGMLEACLTLEELEALVMKRCLCLKGPPQNPVAATRRRDTHAKLEAPTKPSSPTSGTRRYHRMVHGRKDSAGADAHSDMRNWVSAAKAAKILHIRSERLVDAVAKQRIPGRKYASGFGHRHTMIHRDTVANIVQDRQRFIDKTAARELLGISRKQYDLLAEAGLTAHFIPESLPPLVDGQHDSAVVKRFIADIASTATEVEGTTVALKDLNLRFTTDAGALKEVFCRISNGRLRPAMGSTDGHFAGFRFSRKEVDTIIADVRHGPGLTIQQVAELTGWKDQCVAQWCKQGLIQHEEFPHAGKVGRIIRQEDLCSFQMEYVPVSTLAGQLGTSARHLMTKLSDIGIETIGAFQDGTAWRGHLLKLSDLASSRKATQ